jgi:hypothetical protein
MRWSVTLQAVGDRVLTREEVVELADAVAPHAGVASGIGTNAYGASLVVEAESRDAAVELAAGHFAQAAATAGLPPWPVSHAEAINEDEDEEA